MKTLIIKDSIHGDTTQVNAKRTYQTKSGKWIAEVDEKEFFDAFFALCEGINECTLNDLHVEADLDDDGTEYSILTS